MLAEDGIKAKLAQPFAGDAEFLRKLKPSLIRGRATRIAPIGPKSGPNSFLVIGVAFAAGVVLAKWIDWRSRAHPGD